jgi:hypothetical protein
MVRFLAACFSSGKLLRKQVRCEPDWPKATIRLLVADVLPTTVQVAFDDRVRGALET